MKTKGALGRHFTEAMWKAAELNESMPPLEGSKFTDENRPFIRPTLPHNKIPNLYGRLKCGGRVFYPKKTFPRTNLNRKKVETAVRSNKDVETCRAWVADFNAHLEETAEDIYAISRVEEQALKGMTMCKAFYGDFVSWPAPDKIP